MFLQTILKQEENSLLYIFFMAQLEEPSKGDCSLQVAKDLEKINLVLTLEEIRDLSVECFRTKVRKAGPKPHVSMIEGVQCQDELIF